MIVTPPLPLWGKAGCFILSFALNKPEALFSGCPFAWSYCCFSWALCLPENIDLFSLVDWVLLTMRLLAHLRLMLIWGHFPLLSALASFVITLCFFFKYREGSTHFLPCPPFCPIMTAAPLESFPDSSGFLYNRLHQKLGQTLVKASFWWKVTNLTPPI